MTAKFGTEGFGFGYQQPQAGNSRPAPRPTDPIVWESVLRETAEAEQQDAPLSAVDREALRNVARQYRGQALTLDPIAIALVQAVILPQLPADPIQAKYWQEIFVQIAQSQLEDARARAQLESLWSWLQGESEQQGDSAVQGGRP